VSRLSKVPEVTVFFWIVKALTTALGESTSDYLVHAMTPVVAVLIGFVAFCQRRVVTHRVVHPGVAIMGLVEVRWRGQQSRRDWPPPRPTRPG
jgi:hypothetical protein